MENQNNEKLIKKIDTRTFLEENKDVYIKKDETKYYCVTCKDDIKVKLNDLSNITRHHNTGKHKFNGDFPELENIFDSKDKSFQNEFIVWMTSNNIPFNKVNSPSFISFLRKYMRKNFFTAEHYQQNLINDNYKDYHDTLINKIKGNDFYLMFDETQDIIGKKILNVMCGKLIEDRISECYLIDTIELKNTKSETIVIYLNNIVYKLLPDPSEFTKFKLLITDGASYCLKVGRILKETFTSLIHVTCILHMLHNLGETIRKIATRSNKLAAYIKGYFKYNRKNKGEFEKVTKLKIPNFPVITRWGTWFKFIKWLFYNFQTIKEYFEDLKKKSNFGKKIIKITSKKDMIDELINLENYFFLIEVIEDFEHNSSKMAVNVKKIKDIKDKLVDDVIKRRYENLLEKNPGWSYLQSFNVLTCNKDERCFAYAPITTLNNERSFSNLNYILTAKRTNMSTELLRSSLGFYYNTKLE